MKAKLIKDEDGYSLFTREENSTNREFIASTSGMYVDYKLSKQNCDELFGIVDVEKLANEYVSNFKDYNGTSDVDFMVGFLKAMELNKDKVFTLEDIISFGKWLKHTDNGTTHYNPHTKETSHSIGLSPYDCFMDDILPIEELASKWNTLQQPTEIEVEIEMEEAQEIYRDGTVKYIRVPKLDSEGYLILKKI